MKIYPKTYEDVFAGDRSLKKCKLERITTDIGMKLDEYTDLLRQEFRTLEVSIFNQMVKIEWLFRRFCYQGYNRSKNRLNGHSLDQAFAIFMRNHVGYHHTPVRFFSAVASYFEDFFPNFNVRNPFEEKMEYPFSFIGFGHLMFVYQMEERLELLKMAEEKEMNLGKFFDYVINYINCLNEERGKEVYCLISSSGLSPISYVKRIKFKKA